MRDLSRVDLIDETFVVASRKRVGAALCDARLWESWFPGTAFVVHQDRALDGVRWTVHGQLEGSAEVWLEAWADGTIVHAYLRVEVPTPKESRRAAETAAVRRRYELPLKARLRAVKTELEGTRAPGVPRVPIADRVVVSPPTYPPTDSQGQDLMADQTTSNISIAADPSAVMQVIADFDAYPAWAKGVQSATVLSSSANGRAREVAFVLEAAPIQDEYTLRYDWYDDTEVRWSLVEAKMLKAMQGAYVLTPRGAGTDVAYRLAVDLNIPMIGMLKRKGEKVIIDTALRGLKARVESQA